MPGSDFPWAVAAAFGAGGYLLGSVSFSLLLARLRGVDLREVGSGNLGATNTGRALGRGMGLVVYVMDALKGFLPAWLALQAVPEVSVAVGAGAGAMVGHVFPVYLGFRGGKGAATLSGAMLALAPLAMLLAAVPFVFAVALSRFMSLGSLALAAGLPAAVWAEAPLGLRDAPHPRSVQVFALLAGALLVYTHRTNLSRLIHGTERRLGSGRQGDA